MDFDEYNKGNLTAEELQKLVNVIDSDWYSKLNLDILREHCANDPYYAVLLRSRPQRTHGVHFAKTFVA